MKLSSALGGGIAGAVVLTVIHESLRRLNANAPRMDLLGMEAIEKTLDSADLAVPERKNLFKLTMAGDLVSNSLYYSMSGFGNERHSIVRGFLLGLAAGIGAVYLPKRLGLKEEASTRTQETLLLTVALYSVGGLVAGVTGKYLEQNTK
jgi:hypothetical protein